MENGSEKGEENVNEMIQSYEAIVQRKLEVASF
jgi:hypothetical protein